MPNGLRLVDFADRELLAAYDRAASARGGATAEEVGDELGIRGYTVTNPTQSVRVRFGWLRRYGVLDRNTEGLWVPTQIGERLLDTELKKAQARVLEDMDDVELYAAIIAVTRKFANTNNDVAATMMRRQFQHGIGQRQNGRRSNSST